MDMSLNKNEAIAFEKLAMSATMPIFLNWPELGNALLGTATLFEIAKRYFLVTASHIFDGFTDKHHENLAYSDDPINGQLHTLGSLTVTRPTQAYFDVAVIELHDPTTIERLLAGWRFLSLKNVAMPSGTLRDSAFLLAGYPRSNLTPEGGWINNGKVSGQFVSAYSQRIPHVPANTDQPVRPDIDLFCDYGHTATNFDGREINAPSLPGASGASVWEISDSTKGIWKAESAARVVAVQSTYREGEYFRAKSWLAVAEVMKLIDADLATEIRQGLFS